MVWATDLQHEHWILHLFLYQTQQLPNLKQEKTTNRIENKWFGGFFIGYAMYAFEKVQNYAEEWTRSLLLHGLQANIPLDQGC